jgi:hypothetical protein
MKTTILTITTISLILATAYMLQNNETTVKKEMLVIQRDSISKQMEVEDIEKVAKNEVLVENQEEKIIVEKRDYIVNMEEVKNDSELVLSNDEEMEYYPSEDIDSDEPISEVEMAKNEVDILQEFEYYKDEGEVYEEENIDKDLT